jgi:hypothetical protein
MAKKRRKQKSPAQPPAVSKHGISWYAPPWWQERPPEKSAPERINDSENPLTEAFARRQLGDNDHPLSRAHDAGRLTSEYDPALAAARHKAGMDFMALWLIANRGSGRDSTRMSEVHGTGEFGFDEARSRAVLRLIAIRAALGERDATIVQLVCGERWEFAPAVREACGPHYKREVTERVCESLDALIEALRHARVRRGKLAADRFAARGEVLPEAKKGESRAG